MRISAAIKTIMLPVLFSFSQQDGIAQCNPPNFGITVNPQGNSGAATWLAVPNATAYEYYLGPYPSSPPVGGNPIVTGTGVGLTFTANAKYSFCMRTNCGGPFSSWNCDSFTAVVTAPCAAPSTVTATATGTSTASASWAAVSGASGYEYGIALFPSIPSASTQTTSTSVSLAGLLSMGTYVFCVRTKCAGTIVSPVQCDTLNTLVAANIDDVSGNGIPVYPNPVADVLNIAVPRPADLHIFDVRGTKLYSSFQSQGQVKINTGHFAPGIYFLKIVDGSGTKTVRVQKQ